jgi:hypothetical protein
MTAFNFNWHYIDDLQKKKRGRPRIYPHEVTRRDYQHEYYMRVTKKKRAERRKHD